MSIIKFFENLSKEDVLIAGGKGASLGEMLNAGIPVPEGYVVLSNAFNEFLSETDLNVEIDSILDKVQHDEIHTVENASEEIQALILNAKMPEKIEKEVIMAFKKLDSKYVAVRSSATSEDSASAAWAGQLDSFLNTTEKSLLNNVKRCWASLFTPRAIFYRFEKGLHGTDISVAVVVQKMVNSEESGIAFSVHPVTQDYNQLIIEAGFGLGEAIVQGSITPDSYVINKKELRIIDLNVNKQERGLYRKQGGDNEWKKLGEKGEKQVLTEKEILELSKLIVKIEKHYGFPCDIEWAKEKGKFYIVQSRPITTLIKTKSLGDEINLKKYSDYQRLFQGSGMPFLISSIFMSHYKNLNGLAVFVENIWRTFLPNEVVKKTLEDGLKLYSNKDLFEKYRYDFENYKHNGIKLFEKVLSQDKLSKKDTERIFEILVKNFFYYSKTEFFYLDKAYEYSHRDKITKENLDKFDKIKNTGREYLNRIFFGDSAFLFRFLAKLGEQFSENPDDLKMYDIEEIFSLFDGLKVQKETLDARRNAYIMQTKDDNLKYILGKEAEETAKNFLESGEKNVQFLRGVVASRGRIKGKVKVIDFGYDKFHLYEKMIEEMEKGDILVSETTAPELMAACRKAGAILTNQGGQISHAAIVSREMGIPCIVALGNVTEILKDGDLVEVDAYNGVVKILEKFNKEEEKEYLYLEHVPGGYPLDVIYINLYHVTAPSLRKEFGIDSAGSMALVFEDGGYTLFIEKDKWFKAGKRILDYTLKKESNINNWKKRFKKWLKDLDNINKKYSKIEFNNFSNKELYKELEKVIDIEKRNSIECCDIVTNNYGTNLIYKELERNLKEMGFDPNKTAQVLLRSTGNFPILEYEDKISSLALKLINKKIYSIDASSLNKKIKGDIKDIIKKYGWLDASIIYPPKSVERVVSDINDLLSFKEKLPQIIKERMKERLNKKLERKELIKKVISKANLEQKRSLKFTLESAEQGRILVDKIMEFIYLRRKIYEEIAKRLSITEVEVRFLLREEIRASLVDQKIIDFNKIMERKKLCVGIVKEGNAKLYSGKSAQEIKEMLSKFLMVDDQLKGEVAFSKGKIRGVARLVKDVNEMNKVKEGEILVSSRTYPDLLPAMKKAGAIIAELGGLLSHAAIVSRELHIPCIVGVRGAMSKIKDGQLIEVDTDIGKVEIIKN